MNGVREPGDFAGIGLTGPEQAAYTALVDISPATIADLQHATAGYDPHQLALTLDTLEAKGLVTRVPGTPPRYAAVDPEIALDMLILDRETQLRRARLAAQRLAERFRDRSSRRDPAELIEIVTGTDAATTRIHQIQRSARSELRFIDKPPYLLKPGTLTDTENEQLARDIRYRGIYDPAGLPSDTDDLRGDIELTISRGEHARVLANTPIKLILIDDRYACLPLQADPRELVSIVIVHPSGLLEALAALFEALWLRAVPLPPFGTTDNTADAPTDDEGRTLLMLTAGISDNAAAKRLGISPRTYQRRIQDLLTRLDADTRFQAGLAAGRRGWIPEKTDPTHDRGQYSDRRAGGDPAASAEHRAPRPLPSASRVNADACE